MRGQTVAGLRAGGPSTGLLRAVGTRAGARARTSLEANPGAGHRATDAVLTALDRNADDSRNLLYVATSNFPEALDDSLPSRSSSPF